MANQIVLCPHCGNKFTLPYMGMVAASPPPAPAFQPLQQQPNVFINTARRTEPRLKPTGWFGNAFGTTMGVLLALATVFLGVPILMCGVCLVVGGIGTATMPPPPTTTVVQGRKIQTKESRSKRTRYQL